MQQQTRLLFIGGLVLILILVGLYYYKSNQGESVTVPENVTQEGGVMISPPPETINQETGALDETRFEENQAVSNDSELNTLESELNGTVILEEDFSDL